MNSMTSSTAIKGRVEDRLRALWGCEGATAKNALDANTDCQSLLKQVERVQEVVRETRDDFAPDRPPFEVTDLLDRIETAMESE